MSKDKQTIDGLKNDDNITMISNEQINDDNNDNKKNGRLTWNDQTEELLVGWADNGAIYKWLHEESHKKYRITSYWYALPIIILSGALGILNVSLEGYVPPDYMKIAQASIGGINFFVTVLTIIQNYFKYAESSDEHRKSGIGWGKFYRNISIELSVNRSHRKDPDFFIKLARNEYDRLLEESPTIPDDIIEKFNTTFKKQQKTNKKKLDKLKKKSQNQTTQLYQSMSTTDLQNIDNLTQNDELILPDICGTIVHTKVFKDKNVDIPIVSEKSSNDVDYIKLFEEKFTSLENIINEKLKPINEPIKTETETEDSDINKKLYKKINELETFLFEIKNSNQPINPNINANINRRNIRSYSINEKDDKPLNRKSINLPQDNYINNARNILNEIKSLNKNNQTITSTVELEKNKDSNILNELVNKGAVKKMLNRYTIDLGKPINTPILNSTNITPITTPTLKYINNIKNNNINDVVIDINSIKDIDDIKDDNIKDDNNIAINNPLYNTDTDNDDTDNIDTDTDTDNEIDINDINIDKNSFTTPKAEEIKKIDLSDIPNLKLE